MNKLPPELLQLTYGYLDDVALANACYLNPDLTKKICNNTFWINKIVNKFKLSIKEIDRFKGKNTYWAYYSYLSKNTDNKEPGDILWDSLGEDSSEKNTDLVIIALRRGADVHAHDDSALLSAAEEGYLETVKVLLAAGANVHAIDDYALVFAAKEGHTEVVKVLLKAGANPHGNNDRAIEVATENGHTEIVKLLKQYSKS